MKQLQSKHTYIVRFTLLTSRGVCLRVRLTYNCDSGTVSKPKDNSFRQPLCLRFECDLTDDTKVWDIV